MSAIETAPDVVATRTSRARPKRPATVAFGRAVLWLMVLLLGAVTLFPLASFTSRELGNWSLVQAEDEAIRAELSAEWPEKTSAARLETLAELGLQIQPQNEERSLLAATWATAKDPSRAGAWAIQAYLETRRAKQVNSAALEALSRSMDACPLCNQELIRWRFNFVLANWAAMPEPLRRRAFEHADILRWMGDNGEFLAEMRIKARQAGIPYDAYRSAVKTPVRSWDLEPLETRSAPAATGG
jgi:hypothetical protein